MGFENRLVVVTGGSRGIGRATCLVLAKGGYDVAIVYHTMISSAETVLHEIENFGAGAGRAMVFKADISNEADVKRLFSEIAASFGKEPYGLVNSAGVLGPKDEMDIVELKKEDMDMVFATNVYGPFYCCREFVQRKREITSNIGQLPLNTRHGEKSGVHRGGAIVNVSSGMMKLKGHPMFYAMSKGALDSMMVGLSKSLPQSDGIRINAVAPGTTQTDMVSAERAETLKSVIPMGRVAKPEEVAECITFLLDDKAGYCSGATLNVTGGR